MLENPLYGLMQATVVPSDEWKCILWQYTYKYFMGVIITGFPNIGIQYCIDASVKFGNILCILFGI